VDVVDIEVMGMENMEGMEDMVDIEDGADIEDVVIITAINFNSIRVAASASDSRLGRLGCYKKAYKKALSL
jgi:hypothetical protein